MHDQSNVLAILEKLHAIPPSTFTQARPFPHVVIDNIFPDQLLSDIHNVLPISADEYWDKSDEAGIEVKWRSRWISEYDIPQPARELVRFLNSGAILRELSRLTGVDHLISDPYYSGGGFNLIRRGGHLDVHVDGNWHDIMQVNRRLNLILYLNPEWKETWGGHLHFYDSAANQPEVSVLPKSNRLLIFETTDYRADSVHRSRRDRGRADVQCAGLRDAERGRRGYRRYDLDAGPDVCRIRAAHGGRAADRPGHRSRSAQRALAQQGLVGQAGSKDTRCELAKGVRLESAAKPL